MSGAGDYVVPDIDHPIDHLVATNPRVAALREQVIEIVPRNPANQETLGELRGRSINQLFGIYLNWANRLIPPKPRQVMVWDGFWTRNDPRRHADALNAIIDEARIGTDLTPYLSPRVHTHGFMPRSASRKGINWGDKDMALNAHDVHHLHLVPADERGKRSGQSRELLYVDVSRDELLLLMLGDHKSFDDGTLFEAVSEHRASAGHIIRGVVGLSRPVSAQEGQLLTRHGVNAPGSVGSVVTPTSMVSSAGTSVHHTMHVDRCCEAIETIEPALGDREELARVLSIAPSAMPIDPDWRWRFWYGDLQLIDERSDTGYCVLPWRR